ncbi:MAG: hypothetical protein H6977_16250 [Gammaproteobacteria bacterium]|nr:hypothetical protein [Planctomycetota bacterium]MCB1746175.1 hypothetical protein [Gammaproteobacteria bacterium]MCP5201556.1 hypothetical protein [Gammaproteobacteria bacterium]
MGDVVPFRKAPRKKKGSGKTLCKSGFHKWEVDGRKQFDVRQGKLVTIRRCIRCGETKVTLD